MEGTHYQLANIPCPRFGQQEGPVEKAFCTKLNKALGSGDLASVERECLALAGDQGCSPTLERAIADIVRHIEREEEKRGGISRTERSQLAESSERCQIMLDRLLLCLLGLDQQHHEYIRQRLDQML